MNRLCLIRGLRIAWSVWWGVLCVLLVVLWVRSYWYVDIVGIPTAPPQRIIAVSDRGRIFWDEFTLDTTVGDTVSLSLHNDRSSVQGFIADFFDESQNYHNVAYGFIALIAGAFALLPWADHKWRYSLRILLIATALIAGVLGLVVWATR